MEVTDPRGIEERMVRPWIIPGKVRSSMYRAAPVTLSFPSFLVTLRPTAGMHKPLPSVKPYHGVPTRGAGVNSRGRGIRFSLPQRDREDPVPVSDQKTVNGYRLRKLHQLGRSLLADHVFEFFTREDIQKSPLRQIDDRDSLMLVSLSPPVTPPLPQVSQIFFEQIKFPFRDRNRTSFCHGMVPRKWSAKRET